MSQRFQGLWRHSDFLKLWSGQSISVFGSLVGRIALPMLIVLVLNATPMQAALVRSLEVAPGLVVGLFAGVWVDRLRRRPIMIWVDLGRAVLLGIVPLLYLLGRLSMGYVYGIAFLVSILTILFDVSYESYLPTLVPPADLVEANSKMGATASIAEITGFGLAGMLVQFMTAPVTILIDAVSFVVSALSLGSIRTPEPPPPAPEARESLWAEAREGVRVLFGEPILRALAIADGVNNLFGNIIGVVIMLFVLRDLHLSPGLSGVIFALGGISSLVGALLAGPALRRFGLGATLIGSTVLTIIGTAFMPMAMGPMWLVVLMLCVQQLLGDGAATIYIIHAASLRQAVTPNRVMGRVSATLRVGDWGFQLVGTLLGGVLGETIGLRGALVVAVAGKLLSLLWLWFSPVRSMQEQPEPITT